LVQAKGLGFSFQVSIHCRMSASRAAMLVWTPRRMSLSVIRPKKRSTWLTQDDPVGVKWTWNLAGAGYRRLSTVDIKPPWSADRSAPAEVVVVECLGM
jgi:hypothetical protein